MSVSEAPSFDYLCRQLEERTSLNRLEARGTVRLALKQAGLEAATLRPEQAQVLADRVLPGELASRGIAGAEALCGELRRGLSGIASGPAVDSPEAVFARLGGGS